ncbi:hypothetical protein H5410_008389 [Solanum commersonii]|uniref:Uncharacterized protein n=1 Tax=Solanum commersonii TaxID=4109 RepID=A0A9J6AFM2_SOLCO|nr:hypothetical protein H5410_008389 [Solanum commersonii]
MSRRSHCSSILPRKKKFFATSESTRKAAGKNNIKTVHDVPLKPGNLSLSANYADQIQNCSATSILKLQDHLPGLVAHLLSQTFYYTL